MDERRNALSELASGVEYWRVQRDMTRTELAKRAGVTPATVIKLLKGQPLSIQLHIVEALATALDVSVSALYGRIDDDVLEWVRGNTASIRDFMTRPASQQRGQKRTRLRLMGKDRETT